MILNINDLENFHGQNDNNSVAVARISTDGSYPFPIITLACSDLSHYCYFVMEGRMVPLREKHRQLSRTQGLTSPSRTKAPGSWHRRRAAAQRTRHVLATIFFPADEPARGWVLTVIAVIASVAAILRLGSNGMNTLWAEDGQIFYGEAMHSYVHAFFQSYYGYWQATPRIIAAVVVLSPVSLWYRCADAVPALKIGRVVPPVTSFLLWCG